MFQIFKDALLTRLLSVFDQLTLAQNALNRGNTLVLPDEGAPREEVTITTFGNTLYTGPAGADVTLGEDARLFRLGGDGQADIQTAAVDARVYGNDADNVFLGNTARDVFYGGTGADVMDGGAGDDVLYGGGGNDRLITGEGRDRAYGGDGDDLIIASGGQSRLYGGAGDDTYRLDVGGDDLHIIFDFEAGDQLILEGAGAFDSRADIVAAGGRVFASNTHTIIRLGDSTVQLRDFALDDLDDAMINLAPEEAGFATIEAFLASGLDDLVTEVEIAGTLYKLRDADPVHAGYKFTDSDGRVWSPDYFVIVAAGQSNMVGSGVGGDFSLSGDVAAYDWVNDVIIPAAYDAAPAGGAARTGAALRNNLYFPMAEALAADLQQPVLVISHAVSGSRIASWLESDTGENWAQLNPEVSAALAHVGQDSADAFIWHQGESDFPLKIEEYQPLAEELVAQVRAQDWAGDDLPFLFGELSRDGVNFRQNGALQEIETTTTDPHLGFVSSAGLISEEASGIHFNGTSLNEFGQRYFEVLKRILDGTPEAPNTAPEINPDAEIVRDITVAEGQELRLDVSDYFTDAEGDELYHYAYLNKRNVYLARTDDQSEDVMVIRPTYNHAGEYRLFLYANDFNLDSEVIRINLTVTEATPLVTLYNNRAFDTELDSYRDYTTGIAELGRNRGFDILDQAAFAGDTDHVMTVEAAHIRGAADITASFTLAEEIRQIYFYGEGQFDATGNGLDNFLSGSDGDNTLRGGDGRDQLLGNGGDDHLFGGASDDRLIGGAGADVLNGGSGRDQAFGGAGDDTFVFADGDTQLYIRDYAAGDTIALQGFAGIDSFDNLVDAALIRISNQRSIIDIGDDRLLIDDVTPDQLTADMFDFI